MGAARRDTSSRARRSSRIRHALALHLLREGASLKTIGDLLGHRSAESTGVYLRLDADDLRDVALPLPAAAVPDEVRS